MKLTPVCRSVFALLSVFLLLPVMGISQTSVKRYLYVATPGIRDYLGYAGHGVLVFDINDHHRFLKRIPTRGFHPDGTPSNVKGISVSIPLNSLYVSTIEGLQRIDLSTDAVTPLQKDFSLKPAFLSERPAAFTLPLSM